MLCNNSATAADSLTTWQLAPHKRSPRRCHPSCRLYPDGLSLELQAKRATQKSGRQPCMHHHTISQSHPLCTAPSYRPIKTRKTETLQNMHIMSVAVGCPTNGDCCGGETNNARGCMHRHSSRTSILVPTSGARPSNKIQAKPRRPSHRACAWRARDSAVCAGDSPWWDAEATSAAQSGTKTLSHTPSVAATTMSPALTGIEVHCAEVNEKRSDI